MKETASMANPAVKEAIVKDYYYLAQSAARWHRLNKQFNDSKIMVNKVNGIKYTERILHGCKPVFKVTDVVLVASGVEGEDLNVEHTNIAW